MKNGTMSGNNAGLTNSNSTKPRLQRGQMTKTTAALISGTGIKATTAEAAWIHGTNIRTAMRLEPGAVAVWFAGRVARTCAMVDASTTIRDDQELTAVVDALIDEFPAMKLDEWDLICRDIERGRWPLFNRLKLPEFVQCARDWETRRCDILERQHRPEFDPHRRASADVPRRVALMLTPDDLRVLDAAQNKTAQAPTTDSPD